MVNLGNEKLNVSEKDGIVATNGTPCYTNDIGPVFSVDDAVNRVGYGKFQLLLTFLAGLGWLADASEIIILSIIGEMIACDWQLFRWEVAVLTSVIFGGMMIGSPVFGAIADIYGRRKCLGASVILLFVFGAVSAASPSFVWMVIFRCCMGFSLGGIAQGLTLCSEYFPSDMRGKAGFYLCYFWSLGTICVILMAWVVMVYTDNWRILLAVAAIPALVVILALKWYPESARFYLVSNRHDQAQKILEKMACMNGKVLPVGNLIHVMECSKRGRIKDLFSKNYRRATILFCYIWFAVAFSYYGIALISPIIIQHGNLRHGLAVGNASLGLGGDMNSVVHCTKFTDRNYIDLLWTSAAEFPGLVIFTLLIEHCNRKVLLSSACFVSAIFTFFLLLDTEYPIIILLFLFGTRAVVLAVFQLILVMMTEAFPTTLRAIAMGTGSSFCRLGGLAVPYVAQVMVVQYPVGAIILLGGVVLLAAVAAMFLPLETRGIHLMESHCSIG